MSDVDVLDVDILHEIDRVFQLEIDTLVRVREDLNEDYVAAAEVLFACPGKVVVSGAGKSGLIGQKISATMVSTGTPAIFLHPNDALHGDVGIIRQGDVVLAISKSGETEEILDILPFLNRAAVPIILITASPRSSLAKNSKIVLCTPVDEEACPLNLAPTSSTTAALVVGDALAMTLMKMRGFEPENFAALHPGGQLGKRLLMMVSDIMRGGGNNPVVKINDSVRNMLYEITNKRCGAVSIIDDAGELVGLVTDHDIRRVLEEDGNLFSLSIANIMNDNPTYTYSDAKAIEALALMENREKPFLLLPVVERQGSKVVGMVHVQDLVAKGL
ncbi:KpsF/GutQ family sugar-phosphate isomerase [SAR202 cluster bacterium AD-802-F09_MRT_200m]|nr:KpsF/GutQ family sugar-phosphate isomerase [SAR202 cluster bacterium AD-802-F09_MRT_200m]